ncbi:Chromosome partitioning ATPase, Mrp family, contains Fe-S cluster [Allochromatium warmingii]|uniref:Chromosome partitioning ATPase, Mrp family, contains Fe-S cluster n=2 Tax=Allochromatium warmingii TaxID=61595 RepID=A0A1H3H5S4_ALLWA|nr:Chromosome partitioning ATPase, Mrp family, contains Fe-S cluster [Allochromatium warmingii]
MERLRKAMERARAERQLHQVQHVQPMQPASPRPITVTTASDYPASAPEPPLAGLPNPAHGSMLLLDDPLGLASVYSGVGEAYEQLGAQLVPLLHATALRTLAITSLNAGAGKTTTALNLAINLARDRQQAVCLVDADLPQRTLGQYFAPSDAPGLSECVLGQRALAPLILPSGLERLTIVPGGQAFADTADLFAAPGLAAALAALTAHALGGFILFDLPPLGTDAALTWLPHLDAVLLVVEAGQVSRAELRYAHELLGTQCLGMVLNKATMRTATRYADQRTRSNSAIDST